jgi:hypothetical protein
MKSSVFERRWKKCVHVAANNRNTSRGNPRSALLNRSRSATGKVQEHPCDSEKK